MANMKTWLASAMLVGGVGGAGAFALAVTNGPAAPTAVPPTSRPSTAASNTGYLMRQTSALLAEDRALQRAVARARKRLGDEVTVSEHSLALLRQRLITTQAALNQARTMQAGLATQAAVPVAAPASHATTGASGAGRAGGGEVDD